ncbi:hypothetical protein PG2029B_1060 [Bifidobacterium pseudolongum subsp. globosum]|uniref:hypothetical protein n=1 Tax=Bifidobacterium pseudolongum TaxID=1694 RepID=UPI0010222E50|nr:hypothetical protein [Bifidobacterium pseudolongum]RYQ28455.1 hypothetical protein PG2029B_1060 [Bifidobacterium pseudolongum subsp. globosum]
MRRTLHHNLIVNPKPVSLAGWSRFGDCEVRMVAAGDAIWIKNTTGGGGRGIDLPMPTLPAGDYVARLHGSFSGYTPGETVLLVKKGGQYIAVTRFAGDPGGRGFTTRFTLDTPGCNILVTPPEARLAAIAVKRFLITTASDAESMLAAGVEWFDGDGYQLGGGGLIP